MKERSVREPVQAYDSLVFSRGKIRPACQIFFFFFFITSHACYKYNYIQYSIAKSVKVTIFKKSKKFTPAQNYLTVAKNRCVLYV